MQLLDWPFLDALQTGALTALFGSFITDALTRRDRMMGWLAMTCLFVGMRHAVLAIATQQGMNADLMERGQSLLVVLGFITLCAAVADLFPSYVPRRFPIWITLAMLPNFFRNFFLPHPGFLDTWMHHFTNLIYLLGCGLIVHWALKARQGGDPMGRRIFLGFLGVTIPVVVEVVALSFFDLKIRLSGFSIMVLAMAIGTSWQWLVVNAMETRIHGAELEVESWRGLVPGTAFRTDQPSSLMDRLFGPTWEDRVRLMPEARLIGSDGHTYRVRSRILDHQERIGWCEREEETQPGIQGFLAGWTVGLGMDDPAESARLQGLLKSWGAEVQLWGTVPPREGPFPSVLLWAREPSILAVWREDDLLRRRPRWVQIGGPATDGPHARLESGVAEQPLRVALEGLLSRH